MATGSHISDVAVSQVWIDPVTRAIVGTVSRQGDVQAATLQLSNAAAGGGLPSAGQAAVFDGAGNLTAASPLSLALAPAGATAETITRLLATSASGGITSGTLYLNALALPQGLAVNNLSLLTGATVKAGTGGTYHGWYVLLDGSRNVVAVSADQTDASTTWGTANTFQPLALSGAGGAPYVTTYGGLFYPGVMISLSGGTTPTFTCGPGFSVTAGIAAAPVITGLSSTGLTTPPAIGTQMAAITVNGNHNFYAYTS